MFYLILSRFEEMIIIIMSLFKEDKILSKYTNLTYGPPKNKNTSKIIIYIYTTARCLADLKFYEQT